MGILTQMNCLIIAASTSLPKDSFVRGSFGREILNDQPLASHVLRPEHRQLGRERGLILCNLLRLFMKSLHVGQRKVVGSAKIDWPASLRNALPD